MLFAGLVQRLLAPSKPVLRVAALAAGAGGLAAFFGLPLASAFFALETKVEVIGSHKSELEE